MDANISFLPTMPLLGIKQIAVVTKNGAVGEILSTALFAASPEQREALLVNLRPLLIDYFLIGY